MNNLYKFILFFFISIIIIDYYKKYRKYKEKYINLKNKSGGNLNYKNELWIYPNFFNKNDFEKIKSHCNNLQFKNDKRWSDRKTVCLNKSKYNELYNLIYKNKKFIKLIKQISKNKKIKKYPSYPIEYRIYPTNSSGMRWHSDTSMFTPDALEVVLTLSNTSDSKFLWKTNKSNYEEIKPEENMLSIVKPLSVVHKVTPVNYGNRTILKFIVEYDNSVPNENYFREIKNCPE